MISYPQEPHMLDLHRVYGLAEGEDGDYDYDEYDFHPSISPYALYPAVVGVATHEILPPLFETELRQLPPSPEYEDDGIEWFLGEDSLLLSPAYSPTYTDYSEDTFPSDDPHSPTSTTRLSVVGYSKVFTSGLLSKSRKITRQLDWLRRKLQAVLERLKPTTA